IETVERLGLPLLLMSDRFPGDPRALKALAAHARNPDYDILETHGYKANVLAGLLARRLRKPWIAFLHGATTENWKVRAYYRLERLAVRRADRIVCVSREMVRRMAAAGMPASRLCAIHNACLDPSPRPREGSARRPHALKTIGVVGRLSPEKGVDVAL